MALIQCPECYGKVSDKAASCPHCGYPMQNQTIESNQKPTECIINGVLIDCSEILEFALKPNNEINAIGACRKITGCGVYSADQFVKAIRKEGKVPDTFTMSDARKIQAVPNCPVCRSRNVVRVTAGARAIDGFFFGKYSVEGRAQFWCKACNHRW